MTKRYDWREFETAGQAIKYFMTYRGMSRPEAEDYLHECVPKESHYQEKIITWIKRNVKGAFIWKATQGAYSRCGIPDVCVIYHGTFYGFEIKRPLFGITSQLQRRTIADINQSGGKACIVTYIDEVQKILLPEGGNE